MPHKEIRRLSAQLEQCYTTSHDIWFGRKKFSTKHEDRLRERIHEIDLLAEQLSARLWELYEELDYEPVEEVDEFQSFDRKKEMRMIYCDGLTHFIISAKNDKLRYTTPCRC